MTSSVSWLNLTTKTFSVTDQNVSVISPPMKWRKRFKAVFDGVSLDVNRKEIRDKFICVFDLMMLERPDLDAEAVLLYAPSWAIGPIEEEMKLKGYNVHYVLFGISGSFQGEIIQ